MSRSTPEFQNVRANALTPLTCEAAAGRRPARRIPTGFHPSAQGWRSEPDGRGTTTLGHPPSSDFGAAGRPKNPQPQRGCITTLLRFAATRGLARARSLGPTGLRLCRIPFAVSQTAQVGVDPFCAPFPSVAVPASRQLWADCCNPFRIFRSASGASGGRLIEPRTTRNWLPKPATIWFPQINNSLARNVVTNNFKTKFPFRVFGVFRG